MRLHLYSLEGVHLCYMFVILILTFKETYREISGSGQNRIGTRYTDIAE